MPLPEPWPLEYVFGATALWSGFIGLFLLAVEAMTGAPRAYPLAGFFYMLTRAALVALLALLLWENLPVLRAKSGWGDLVPHLFIVLILALAVLENLVVLAHRVFTDRYGSSSATRAP